MLKGAVISEIEDNKGIIRNRKSEVKQQNRHILLDVRSLSWFDT